jgi:tRNA-2-methylthio-N6-dimethylallyladenosine synthase
VEFHEPDGRGPKAGLHQDLRLPDERLRLRAHGGRAGARGLCADDRADDADLVVLNTCHIREKAAEKVYSELGRCASSRSARARRPRDPDDRGRRLRRPGRGRGDHPPRAGRRPRVGPQTYHRLPELLARRRGEKVVDTDFPVEDKFDAAAEAARDPRRGVTGLPHRAGGLRQVLHLLRRALYARRRVSRPVAQIVAEASGSPPACARSRCSARTSTPITATGPTAAPGAGPAAAPAGRDPGLARLRYTTSHPRDMDDELIAAHRDLPALMPYLHLPVQSGSDRILKAMNRATARADYLRLDRAHPRRAAGHRAVGRFHRRLPRRDRRGFRGDAASSSRGRLRLGLLVQVFARGPARPAPRCRTRCPRR